MKILLDKNMIVQILEKYYKEQLDIEGKVKISVFKEFGSYGYDDIEEALINIELVGNMMLLGKSNKTIITISLEEMIDAIKYYLEQENYVLMAI